jgi:UPF0755 protein
MDDNKLIDDKRKKEILDELLNNMSKNEDEDKEDINLAGADIESETDNELPDESSSDDLNNNNDNDNDNDDNNNNDDNNDEEDRFRRSKKRKHRKGSNRLIFGLLLTTVILSAAIISAVLIINVAKEILGIGRANLNVVVEIPANSGTADIAEILYKEGIISDTRLFRIFSKIKGSDGTFIAGSHKMNQNMTYGDIVEELQSDAINEREVADVTFPEGITLLDAAKKLEEKGVCSADEFIKEFNIGNYGFDFEKNVTKNPLKFYKMEGYCFPDTYRFYLNEDPKIVAKKIYKNFDAKITPDYYGRMKDLNMTQEQLIILASMVQAEAASKSDMKKVASVFLNRLNNPDEFPQLQSDPTSKYVEEVIKPNIEVSSEEMYKAYDTYQGTGLPPGPICNPGIDAITAVLYPADTDYYYFCSNLDTGEFYYAKTLEEHEANLVEAGLAQ